MADVFLDAEQMSQRPGVHMVHQQLADCKHLCFSPASIRLVSVCWVGGLFLMLFHSAEQQLSLGKDAGLFFL